MSASAAVRVVSSAVEAEHEGAEPVEHPPFVFHEVKYAGAGVPGRGNGVVRRHDLHSERGFDLFEVPACGGLDPLYKRHRFLLRVEAQRWAVGVVQVLHLQDDAWEHLTGGQLCLLVVLPDGGLTFAARDLRLGSRDLALKFIQSVSPGMNSGRLSLASVIYQHLVRPNQPCTSTCHFSFHRARPLGLIFAWGEVSPRLRGR